MTPADILGDRGSSIIGAGACAIRVSQSPQLACACRGGWRCGQVVAAGVHGMPVGPSLEGILA
jgi:hypothetical protein